MDCPLQRGRRLCRRARSRALRTRGRSRPLGAVHRQRVDARRAARRGSAVRDRERHGLGLPAGARSVRVAPSVRLDRAVVRARCGQADAVAVHDGVRATRCRARRRPDGRRQRTHRRRRDRGRTECPAPPRGTTRRSSRARCSHPPRRSLTLTVSSRARTVGGRRRIGGRRSMRRVALVAIVVALIGSGCAFIASRTIPKTGPATRVHILTPFDRTQADPAGAVPVTIRVDPPLDPATLRVVVSSGRAGWTSFSDITSRLTRNGTLFTGTVHAAELRAGLTTIEATGAVSGQPVAPRDHAFSTLSFEPGIDLTTASRCDVLDPAKCLLPFPNDWFTTQDGTTNTGRRVNFAAGSKPAK